MPPKCGISMMRIKLLWAEPLPCVWSQSPNLCNTVGLDIKIVGTGYLISQLGRTSGRAAVVNTTIPEVLQLCSDGATDANRLR